jgi:hypothetical protein
VNHTVHKYLPLLAPLFSYPSNPSSNTSYQIQETHTYTTCRTTNRHTFESSDMDFIESTLLVGATIACVVVASSATLILGLKLLRPLTDLIHQGLVNRPRKQDLGARGDALVFTGIILVLIAFVTLFTQFVQFEKDGHTMTLWIFNQFVVKGCAEVLVALGLIRLVLATLRGVPQYINRAHCRCCKSGLCDVNDKTKG